MRLNRPWMISLIFALASTGVFASTSTVVEQADSNSIYYVGTRSFKTRWGWTLLRLPLAMTIQVDPVTSEIHESLEGGDLNAQIGGHGKPKTFIPVRGSSDTFHIQFEGAEGSGTLQTTTPARITRSTTTRNFLEGLQWQWKFEIGPEDARAHVVGSGQFEPGSLHIKGTIRDKNDHYLINYSDEYTEVSFDEYLNQKTAILSDQAR